MTSNMTIRFALYRQDVNYQRMIHEILDHHALLHNRATSCNLCRSLVKLNKTLTGTGKRHVKFIDSHTYALQISPTWGYIDIHYAQPTAPRQEPGEYMITEQNINLIKYYWKQYKKRKKIRAALEYLLDPNSSFMSFWTIRYNKHKRPFHIQLNDHPNYRADETPSTKIGFCIQPPRRKLAPRYVPCSGGKAAYPAKWYLPSSPSH